MSFVALNNLASIKEHLQRNKANNVLTVMYFWASWCEPCVEVSSVLHELAADHPTVEFITIDVDHPSVPEISTVFPVKSVPTVVALLAGKAIGIVEGFNIPQTVSLIESSVSKLSSTPTPATTTKKVNPSIQETTSPSSAELLHKRLKDLVNSAPIMLFMKGDPTTPKCGYSRTVVEILNENNVQYSTFDILSDNDVREGLKVLFNWPTYPQLYAKGELLGGYDVICELATNSELLDALPTIESPEQLNNRIRALTKQHHIMLFMKGCPETPRCGYSRKAIACLNEHMPENADFGTFDILSDSDVREGLKKLFNWPTFPQLYVGGELIGGLDVMTELAECDELKEVFTEDM